MAEVTNEAEVAFVTGAGSGIGAATAVRLAARGARVALYDLSEEGVNRTAELIGREGGQALPLVGNVTSDEAVRLAIESTVNEYGRLDTAVACAGIVSFGTALDTSIADWERNIGVNLTGVFHLARHAVPHLLQSKGSFCAVSSENGLRSGPALLAYTAAKHGVIGIVRSLAVDHGQRGVRANAVCPGTVDTPMMHAVISAAGQNSRAEWEADIPLGRFAQPSEIANVIAHLTSAEASYTNGMAYVVDGGASAGFFAPEPED